jgi:predicted MFS family arabinose efflux permease
MGLYDPAFATLTWLYGRDARSSITGITLIAGFASTIGWPLSALLLHEFGWRAACLIWAGLNMLLARSTIPKGARAIISGGLPISCGSCGFSVDFSFNLWTELASD